MRRTKEEAARTRAAIMEAALSCFDRHGIANSTLDQIASAAKITKGAIYHHFEGKREILHEIREQLSLPLLDEADTTLLHGSDLPALDRVERFLIGIVEALDGDRRKRLAFTVMQFKCEYVDDLAGELVGMARNHERLAKAFEGAYREAAHAGELSRDLHPEIAAAETVMFLSGLLRLWLLHDKRHPIQRKAMEVIRAHVRSRRSSHKVARGKG